MNRTLVCILLALILAGSNIAYSAHVSSHALGDINLCSLCVHPGGSNSAIAHQPGPLFTGSPAIVPVHVQPPARVQTVELHAHRSRAPPQNA